MKAPAEYRPESRSLLAVEVLLSPAAATICGDGVSPAANAAARIPAGQRSRDRKRGGRTRQRFRLKAAKNNFLDDGIEIFHHRRWAAGSAVQIAVQHTGRFLRESPLAREHFVQHKAERINVTPRADLFAGELLRRHVGGRPAAHFGPADVVGDSRQSKIRDDDLAAAIEHDIGGLQIAVQDSLGVGRREARAQLAGDLDGFVLRKTSNAAKQRCEIFAVDVLHREECLSLDVANVVHAAHIRMRNAPCDPNLVAKAFEQSFVARCGVRQEI